MWYSRLLWNFFLPYAALVILALIVCVAAVSGWQEEQLVDQVGRRLRDSAILLRDHLGQELEADGSDILQELVRSLGQQTEIRITLVAPDGKVLADSEQPEFARVVEMENHIDRDELRLASRFGEGTSQRTSQTLGEPFLYFAIAVRHNDGLAGFVRCAQSMATIRAEVRAIRRLIWSAGLVVGSVGLAITYFLTQRMLHPISELTSAAQAIASGDYPERIDVHSNDELGTLARAFEHMVHELQSREQDLRTNAQQQKAILGGMIEGVIAVDNRHRLLLANAAARRALSFQIDSVEGIPLMEVVPSHEMREVIEQALATGELCRRSLSWQADTMRVHNVHAAPLPGEPCPGVVLVLHDVTELNRLETVRQEFVANVSHELKTPLSSIKAYTETLLYGAIDDTEHATRFLGRIDEQADRLHDLILDLLSLARIETGAGSLELTDVPLEEEVSSCLADCEAQARAAKICLHYQSEDSGIIVRGEQESIRQVLTNLIDNAIKYTPAGGAIDVRLGREIGFAVIDVCDTGIGIAPKHQQRLFERFYRVDKARSRELGGTGLGLAIVKHLSQAMGGTVSVESKLGKGSTFQVRLPLA